MKTQNVLPAEAEKQCDACKRFHRKVYKVGGYWVGGTCKEHYEQYMARAVGMCADPEFFIWLYGQKVYDKIKRMRGD